LVLLYLHILILIFCADGPKTGHALTFILDHLNRVDQGEEKQINFQKLISAFVVFAALQFIAGCNTTRLSEPTKPEITVSDWFSNGTQKKGYDAYSTTISLWLQAHYNCRYHYVSLKIIEGIEVGKIRLNSISIFFPESETARSYMREATIVCKPFSDMAKKWISGWNKHASIKVSRSLMSVMTGVLYKHNSFMILGITDEIEKDENYKLKSLKQSIFFSAAIQKGCRRIKPELHGEFAYAVNNSVSKFYEFVAEFTGKDIRKMTSFTNSIRC